MSSLADARAAVAAGADRLELCSCLEVGGLTPSVALLESVLQQVSVPVVAMIRPRPGGFNYEPDEFRTALLDAEWALSLGAKGIVFGLLTHQGCVDALRCREIIAAVGNCETVFHRAFDYVLDPLVAADQLVELGVTRVLTSGRRSSALEGAELIRAIAEHTSGRLVVMPGGGICPENVIEVIEQTGCNEIHMGAALLVRDGSVDANRGLELAATHGLNGGAYRKIDVAKVRGVVDLLTSRAPDSRFYVAKTIELNRVD